MDSLSSVTQILQSTCSSLSNEISGFRKDMDTLKTQVVWICNRQERIKRRGHATHYNYTKSC